MTIVSTSTMFRIKADALWRRSLAPLSDTDSRVPLAEVGHLFHGHRIVKAANLFLAPLQSTVCAAFIPTDVHLSRGATTLSPYTPQVRHPARARATHDDFKRPPLPPLPSHALDRSASSTPWPSFPAPNLIYNRAARTCGANYKPSKNYPCSPRWSCLRVLGWQE